jgi:hypothetical protein
MNDRGTFMPMNSYSFRRGSDTMELDEHLLELLLRLRKGEEQTSSAIRALKEIHYEPVDLQSLKITWPEDQLPGGKRRAPRYDLHRPVLICNHCKVFRTETENISMTGLLLKDTLPEDFSRYPFDVILIESETDLKKRYILFRGRAAAGKLRSERVYFEFLAKGSKRKLSELIDGLLKEKKSA